MSKHLAIMPTSVIDAILSGKKTIETRFSKHKLTPFGEVNPGDLVYMKPSGKDIIGCFRVKKVFYYSGLEKQDFERIFAEFGDKILSKDEVFDKRSLKASPSAELSGSAYKQFKKEKMDSKFGTLIFIQDAERFLVSPIKIEKSDKRGWMVIG